MAFLAFFIPGVAFGVGGSDFQNAAQLLSAARRGDTQTVQSLLNAGVDINYVDSTGLSLVCTAVMNNDKKTIQILQMYGADASGCDRQIKKYKQKSKVAAKGEEYDFFSGLSSSHIVALSAVGIAAVIGGVALLSNIFDSDHKNNNGGSSSGSRPNGSGDGSATAGNPLLTPSLPYGPACKNGNCPTVGLSESYKEWEPNTDTLRQWDFEFMSDPVNGFNYLMASHAYDAFIRGYLGMNTIRVGSDKLPFDLTTLDYAPADRPDGGKPVNVAMITGSGVNLTGSAEDGLLYWFDDSQISNAQQQCKQYGSNSEQCSEALAAAKHPAHKYGNFSGNSMPGTENATGFDLSGIGTVFDGATIEDTILAKIIAGWEGNERAAGDYYGFIPNGQLNVYRTGDGKYFVDPDSSAIATGSYSFANGTSIDENDTITLFGDKTLKVTKVDGTSFIATYGTGDDMVTYHGFVVGNTLYIDSNADKDINQIYTMNEGSLTLSKVAQQADYKTYTAMLNAIKSENSKVVANFALPAASSGIDYKTVTDAKALYDRSDQNPTVFFVDDGLFNQYYDYDGDDTISGNKKPSYNAQTAFDNLSVYNKIWVNPAGWNRFGEMDGASLAPQVATFENFMPVVVDGMENLFMTVVAVQPGNATGTSGQSIADYSAAGVGTMQLSQWSDSDENYYQSRICGLTGTGNNGAMNPWCFAAPGTTDLEATAAMAGAVALVHSAFDYLTPKQVFLLLALTADGPYLGTNPNSSTNTVWSDADLIAYLKKLYTLPDGMYDDANVYLDNFKQAFGYGVVNLERATRPGTNIYFFNGTDIISGTTNKPYWGKALQASTSRGSSVFSLTGRGAVETAFFDVLESRDGSMALPRIWKNTLSLNTDNGKHALYMGDVLGEFNVDSTNKRSSQVGQLKIDMAMSERSYNDNLNGLDDMRVAWTTDNFDVAAQYQHHLTDGESRFDGRANGVLGLVSNTVSAQSMYKNGRFGFGGRAFVGAITDENLLDKDPVVTAQFEPGRLGLANGGSFDAKYTDDKFGLNISFGMMRENNTVLGMVSDGLLAMNNANTTYIDTLATYKPFEKVKLSLRGTFAETRADKQSEFISELSDIKSNAFAFGTDVGNFSFTFALPLAVTKGTMGYGYADFDIVENNGKYEIAVNNPHMEYIDLSAPKRELRFSASYKHALGDWTDAGVGLIYRVNPNNIDAFGNESVLMFKLHHRLGI